LRRRVGIGSHEENVFGRERIEAIIDSIQMGLKLDRETLEMEEKWGWSESDVARRTEDTLSTKNLTKASAEM